MNYIDLLWNDDRDDDVEPVFPDYSKIFSGVPLFMISFSMPAPEPRRCCVWDHVQDLAMLRRIPRNQG